MVRSVMRHVAPRVLQRMGAPDAVGAAPAADVPCRADGARRGARRADADGARDLEPQGSTCGHRPQGGVGRLKVVKVARMCIRACIFTLKGQGNGIPFVLPHPYIAK